MITSEKAKGLKEDFPIFKVKMHGKPLTYLDSAATSQKPKQVIDAITRYYASENANIHRGIYQLSQEATLRYEKAHEAVGHFINAGNDEIIFTRSTTESINLLAYTLSSLVKKEGRKDIVLTEMEHHSNLIPWQQFAIRNKMNLRFIPIKKDFTLDYAAAEKMITGNTAILSLNHVSNALGTVNDVRALIRQGKEKGAFTVVDGAQSAPHQEIDVKSIGCDFFAFSGHKMLGPTGIGVLYGKKGILERLPPFNFGGDMIRTVTYQDASWNDLPWKFEAGTPHIAGGIGLAEAVAYLKKVGMSNIEKWEKELLSYALERLMKLKGIAVYSAGREKGSGILSFNLDNIHAHDVASLLDDDGICIRGGHHCAMPLMAKLGVTGTSRASFYLYNNFDDIDIFIKALQKTQQMFGG